MAVVDILGAGRIYGLVPALDGELHVAQLEALTETTLLCVGRDALLEKLKNHLEVAMHLLRQVTSYIRKTERRLATAF